MQTYISILRGINVGGRNAIKMQDLKDLLSKIGLKNISTYIQSGNIIFTFKKADPKKISALINGQILSQYGFDVPVITMTVDELAQIVKDNPFLNDTKKDPSYFHISFLDSNPLEENIEKISGINYDPDEFVVLNKAVYLYCSGGYGETKLSNKFLETKLKVNATTRNWKTANALLNMADKIF